MKTNNTIPWWKRKEIQGTALMILSYSPEIINAFVQAKVLKDYSTVARLALPLGAILTLVGLRKGYKSGNLYDGISKVMDKIPDAVTGVRGSAEK